MENDVREESQSRSSGNSMARAISRGGLAFGSCCCDCCRCEVEASDSVSESESSPSERFCFCEGGLAHRHYVPRPESHPPKRSRHFRLRPDLALPVRHRPAWTVCVEDQVQGGTDSVVVSA